jgi:RNA polymerase sigma-70 factor (ECF subfamily)
LPRQAERFSEIFCAPMLPAGLLRMAYMRTRETTHPFRPVPQQVQAAAAVVDGVATADRFSQLYRKYGPVIFARCRRMLGDSAAAEDATQETFIRVARHLDKVHDMDTALRWIYRIATNLCLNEIRDRKLRPLLVTHLPTVDALTSLEDRLSDRNLAHALIAHVPARLRATAWMFHVDGLEQAAIAAILGVSRRTVVYDLAAFADSARQLVTRGTA